MSKIIEVKNLSKKYNIAHQQGGYIALRDVIVNIIKNPFKHLKHKVKKIIRREANEDFWALDDINFSVERGEVVGIIGHNGAGKSTLLKIISQITPPTNGEIIIRGQIGSLLEVGTGFHPELSGRENIMLNGAILGMPKKEIISKFDQIVEFAGIGKFLDTPVKHYSSGMYVRLAFSVAAHLEPDILIVDEVLAVGDVEFQRKCIGKMNDITKKEGRTIILVSHNMGAIKNLCKKTILLDKGRVIKIGDTSEVIDFYMNKFHAQNRNIDINNMPRTGDRGRVIKFTDCKIINSEHEPTSNLLFCEPFGIRLSILSKSSYDNLRIAIKIESSDGQSITSPTSNDINLLFNVEADRSLIVEASFKNLLLTPGLYWITITINKMDMGQLVLDQLVRAVNFEVTEVPHQDHKAHSGTYGYIHTYPEWREIK